jgi:flagellar hook-associated protein 3 FlgL
MRVNPYPMPDILEAMAQTQKQQQNALLQLASGQRIAQASDDPAGAALLTQVHDRVSQTDSFLRSIGDVTGQLQTADSTLASVVTALQRAISLGVEGATGTLSDGNRLALASEVSGIRDQLLSLANVSYQGRYVFSGTAQVQPFIEDGTTPSGVNYVGNAGVNQVEVGTGFQLQVNLPGSSIFTATAADMFQAINDLYLGLNTNSGIDTAVTSVRQAFDYVASQRVFYGNALNQLTSQQNYLNTQKLQLAQQENTIAGADMTAVASDLVNASNAHDAALAAVGRMSRLSLFDFLQ